VKFARSIRGLSLLAAAADAARRLLYTAATESPMLDAVFAVSTVVFFLISLAYVYACERM